MARLLPIVLTAVVALAVSACGGGGGTVCTPGVTMACVCFDGRSGAQACNAEGSGFGVCTCGGPGTDGGPGSDGGPTPVCAPGATQACVCTSGTSGTQACLGDGSGYGTCSCGSACGTCPPSFICSGTTCTVDPASRWNLVIEDLTVPHLACGGIGWDSTIGSTPDEADPAVYAFVGSRTATPVMTGAGSNASHVVFPGTPTVTNLRADTLQAYLGFDVQDVDVTSNDDMGGAGVASATITAAFGGTQQTTSASDMCTAAGTTGWGPLHWHLARY